ncbi:hypothetical protein J132_02130 [Termitomyces sp. J132]|nr:hypothetical protein H2248_006923 [Termitomyces sp. 'cryptogamus']KNZ72697.1 hypothetical protein J132_02130 [Termitomyces sp. J132]
MSQRSPSLSHSNLIIGSKRKREPSPKRPESYNLNPGKRSLKITIPSLSDTPNQIQDDESLISGLSEPDSLFDEMSPSISSNILGTSAEHPKSPAIRTAPPIHGLFFNPTLLLPEAFAERISHYCMSTYFKQQGVNQVMLFGRFIAPQPLTSEPKVSAGLPPVLHELLSVLEAILLPVVAPETHELLFPRVPTSARQAILNLYQPGEGITPHLDLLQRFGDGIIGVSLGSGCVMQFARVRENAGGHQQPTDCVAERSKWDIYLPERSVIVLSGDARYKWTHGIGKHTEDYVTLPHTGEVDKTAGQRIKRGVRLSITFRWLLPGADVVGEEHIS